MGQTVDLSQLTFEEFVRFVFDHPVPADNETDRYWHPELEIVAGDSLVLLRHATSLWQCFRNSAAPFSLQQIDQGVWFLLSTAGPVNLSRHLADAAVLLPIRVSFVSSMFQVYRSFVAGSGAGAEVTCFEMWWDLVSQGFWDGIRDRCGKWPDPPEDFDPTSPDFERWLDAVDAGLKTGDFSAARGGTASSSWFKPLPAIEYEELTDEEHAILDAMLDTLRSILAIEDPDCQHAALHGLGHLRHPDAPAVVRAYMDQPRIHQWGFDRAWLERCRDGTVM